ncbi:MAG TPA: Wzy polymerase domain-containing protein [Thermoanaerobaculia bacterium]|nr:Wzy polymerase domain-containing protein [Thermoanaerobaculia bacterium]
MIRFSPGPGGSYSVDVDSPQGEGDGFFEIPESLRETAGPEISAGREKPRDAIPRARRLGPSQRQAGIDLFRALFQGDVLERFQASLRPSEKDYGLRIRIELNPRRPELASLQELPWESLCRPETEDFLALHRETPVVRSLRVPRERRPAISPKKRPRILTLSANPAGCTPLDLEREQQNLEKLWKGQIVPLRKTDREEIHRTLRNTPVHVLHYMGHGSFDSATGEGTLLLEGKDGAVLPVSGRALAEDLKRFPDLRLVVLNACHTARSVGDAGPSPFAGVASALVMGGVPAVVAMRQPISDAAAVAFSKTLYEHLAAGDPVEAALAEARRAIYRLDEGSGEWATPVLFLRPAQDEAFPLWLKRLLVASLAAVAILALYFGLSWEQERRSSEALHASNQSLLEAGSTEEARATLLRALEADPGNAAALANLSDLEEKQGHYKDALDCARKAVQVAPGEAVYHYNLGNLLARLGRQEEALESLREALRRKPDYGEAYNEIGSLYLELDRPDDARKEFEAGLRVAPDLAPLHKNLARVDLAEGRTGEAISHLETALRHYEPEDRQGIAEASYWLATAHARAGHGEEACRFLEEVRHEAGAGQWVLEADRLAQQLPCRRVS